MGGNNGKQASGTGGSGAKPAGRRQGSKQFDDKQGSAPSQRNSQRTQSNPSMVSQGSGANKKGGDPTSRIVLGKYRLMEGKEDILGKGTSSIARKGIEVATGNPVAIKLYREQGRGAGKVKDTTMQKFKRQIEVLKELMEPFPAPSDKRLWNDVLENVKPSQVFMQLIDYSKDANGEPAPDPEDGMLYVVTELAAYSLKDFLADRREKQKFLSKEAIRDLSKRIIIAMAGLHAKGYVHIDMKPENMMVFDGRLKVIDVDGCVRRGTEVSINDGSISFSPVYCAPEWARFMIKESEKNIIADPALDVWSVGMSLCELVTLDAIWKPQYANFMRNAHSHREAGFLFLEWLGDMQKPILPRPVERIDPGFLDLLMKWLLVANVKQRKTCAECLSNPYLNEGGWSKYSEPRKPKKPEEKKEEKEEELPTTNERIIPVRAPDDSTGAPLYKGTLFKLNTGGDAKDATQWIKRDMWLARNHSLCYFSVKENKRLVLCDGVKLGKAAIKEVTGAAQEFAFEITMEQDEESVPPMVLATESKEEMSEWMMHIKQAGHANMIQTFVLGNQMAEQIEAFRLAVRNRRIKVDDQNKDSFEPMFKSKLWKLKAGGDHDLDENWFLRDMWLAKNGSLVYWSPKEERELVYYTAADISKAKVIVTEEGKEDYAKKHNFVIQLAPDASGVEFEPGEFAAESAEERSTWIEELQKFMHD